ncbi:MAG: hypothetical protein J6S52_05095 [Prevotella sp.]|nr:hypothetical protein [Prevotella sp.]
MLRRASSYYREKVKDMDDSQKLELVSILIKIRSFYRNVAKKSVKK